MSNINYRNITIIYIYIYVIYIFFGFVSCLSLCLDPFEAFIIFSIRHEIRRIDLHKRDYSLLVPGLRNTIALDFHFNRSLLYWTDVVEDKIYRGRLSESGGMRTHAHKRTHASTCTNICDTSKGRCDVLSKESRVLLICTRAAIMEVGDAAGDNTVLYSTVFTYTQLWFSELISSPLENVSLVA